MLTTTVRLKLPLLAAGQAQKHVSVNEALQIIDLLNGVIPVASRALSTPAGTEIDGAVEILAGAGNGDWAGFNADDLALRIDGAWRRVIPSDGMLASIADESGTLVYWDGAAWSDTIPSNGRIKFPAVQNPSADANTLDDYEEGIWTPVLQFSGASTGITYGAATLGRYTKVGNLVTLNGMLTLTSKGSATGAAQITGLPFTSLNDSIYAAVAVGYATGFSSVTGAVLGVVQPNASRIALYQSANGAAAALTQANLGNTSAVYFAASYMAQ